MSEKHIFALPFKMPFFCPKVLMGSSLKIRMMSAPKQAVFPITMFLLLLLLLLLRERERAHEQGRGLGRERERRRILTGSMLVRKPSLGFDLMTLKS